MRKIISGLSMQTANNKLRLYINRYNIHGALKIPRLELISVARVR